MDNRAEVRESLVTGGARITPEMAGIDRVGTRRRGPGLRRDEAARLAGVSVDCCTRLEPAIHSRFIFLDPRARDFHPDWEGAASTNKAVLGGQAGRFPHDKGIAELVGELSVRGDAFRSEVRQ